MVSTHNLDEVERVADRVALISRRLVAIGEPAVLRRQIFGRRLMVHLAEGGPAVTALMVIAGRAGAQDVRRDEAGMSMVLDNPDAEAPAVVRALVEAGASIRAVFDDQPPLEDVYMRLMSSASDVSTSSSPVMISGHRIRTLIAKELREFRSNPAAVLPVVVLVVICVALPFFVLIVIPRVTGESLAADRTIRGSSRCAARTQPYLALLPPGTAAEAFLFQQFLLLFLVAPIVGAVSLAAYSVVGEKQGRTLEPLLTTPITTAELLIAKVLASFLPSLAVEAAGLVVYFALVVRSRHRGR